MKRSKSSLVIFAVCGLFLLFCGVCCWPGQLFITFFTEKNEQRDKVSYRTCTGVVLDAETRKPIAGAQIMARVDCGSLGFETRYKSKYRFRQTNEKGRYRIPRISCYGFFLVESDFELTIYKTGYVAYNSRSIFKDGPRKDFKNKDNTVLLEKWDDKKFTMQDHVEHMGLVGCYPIIDEKSDESISFCREAKEEMIIACMYYYEWRTKSREMCEEAIGERLR